MNDVVTRGRVGTLPLFAVTSLTTNGSTIDVELKRCADALERIAEVFDPTPVRAAFTLGKPEPE